MSVDYSVFDRFCRVPTWTSGHPLDQRRFVDAILQVVDHPDFHPGAMIEYIRNNQGKTTWPVGDDTIEDVLAGLEQQAYAVWYSRRPDLP